MTIDVPARKQFWMVYSIVNVGKLSKFETYEDAEDEARRLASSCDTYVLEPIAFVKQPVPSLPVERLRAAMSGCPTNPQPTTSGRIGRSTHP